MKTLQKMYFDWYSGIAINCVETDIANIVFPHKKLSHTITQGQRLDSDLLFIMVYIECRIFGNKIEVSYHYFVMSIRPKAIFHTEYYSTYTHGYGYYQNHTCGQVSTVYTIHKQSISTINEFQMIQCDVEVYK